MERTLTLLSTAICTAPLLFLLIAWLIPTASSGTGSDVTIGYAYLSVLAGTVAAVIWVIIVYQLTDRYIAGPSLRHLQITDAVLFCGWIMAGWMLLDNQPSKFDYPDSRAVLDVEVKAHPSLLEGHPIEDVAYIRFVGGEDFNLSHPERVREEDLWSILPWQTTLFSVQDWHVRVFLHDQPVSFKLPLPRRPESSMLWSDWFPPSRYQDDTLPEGLMLRYRFRLVPYGSQ